jgi:hypothetical protein
MVGTDETGRIVFLLTATTLSAVAKYIYSSRREAQQEPTAARLAIVEPVCDRRGCS